MAESDMAFRDRLIRTAQEGMPPTPPIYGVAREIFDQVALACRKRGYETSWQYPGGPFSLSALAVLTIRKRTDFGEQVQRLLGWRFMVGQVKVKPIDGYFSDQELVTDCEHELRAKIIDWFHDGIIVI